MTADSITLSITEVVYQGMGLAKLDGLVVFIQGVLPGETVSARIVDRRKRFATAALDTVLEPSPNRVEPDCPLAAVCPGCAYQHAAYEEEIRIKQTQLTNFLEHNCGVDASVCGAPFPSPTPLGYRNKITLHARARNNAAPLIGYIAEDNSSVIDIPECPLAMPAINGRLHDLRSDRAFVSSLAPARSVVLRHASGTGTYHWTSRNRHGAPERISITDRLVTEHTVLGDISTPATGFFQVNPPVMDAMIAHVTRLLEETRPRAFIDAYCGVGIFAIAAARAGVPRVLAFDADRGAVEAAVINARARNITNLTACAEPAARAFAKLLEMIDPATAAVLVDPPRRGLDAKSISLLNQYRPAELLYVSCSPDTLARDLKQLQGAGYRVLSSRLFDMFPRARQFESITRLCNTGRSKPSNDG